jgi:Rrf2 family nitric oxide-sensitive transcriptional repressor
MAPANGGASTLPNRTGYLPYRNSLAKADITRYCILRTAMEPVMRLTAFTDYTIRTLIYLAVRPDRLVTIGEIAAAYKVSSNHLMKVVHQLALSGDVVTVRGQHGGMRLGRPPAEINLGTVVRRVEPDLCLAPCFGERGVCTIQSECRLAVALRKGLECFLAELDNYTLSDLAEPRSTLASLLGIPPPELKTGGVVMAAR